MERAEIINRFDVWIYKQKAVSLINNIKTFHKNKVEISLQRDFSGDKFLGIDRLILLSNTLENKEARQ